MLPHQHSSCWISCHCTCGRMTGITVGSFLAGAIQLVCNQGKCLDSCHPGLCISIIWVFFYLWAPQRNNLVCMKVATPALTGPRLALKYKLSTKAATPVLIGPRLAQQHSMILNACQLSLALLTLPVFGLSRADSKMDFESTICHRHLVVNVWCDVHSARPVLQQPALPGFGGREVPTATWARRQAQLQPLS